VPQPVMTDSNSMQSYAHKNSIGSYNPYEAKGNKMQIQVFNSILDSCLDESDEAKKQCADKKSISSK
jgi:hypothetical protein